MPETSLTKRQRHLMGMLVGLCPLDIPDDQLVYLADNPPLVSGLLEQLKNIRGTTPAEISPLQAILTLSHSRIKFPGTRSAFKASDKFTKSNAEITWYNIGSNFTSWYGTKEEKPLARTSLRAHKLARNAKDSEIIAELGGEEKAETTLTELYYLLKKQARGGKGALSLEVWNVFYIKDVSGILRAVDVYWDGDGWYVGANSLDVSTWIEGRQVFSRNYKK